MVTAPKAGRRRASSVDRGLRWPRRLRDLCAAGCALLLLAAGPVSAQFGDERGAAQLLTGTLKRIKETRTVRLGYREAAVPFSFVTGGVVAGYSIDLCRALVDDIASAVGLDSLRIEYRVVTPADRIDQVSGGSVDLECGATTATARRRQQVAFSPLIFVAGTRLLVVRGSPVRRLRDLAGREVVVVRGTTNADVMHALAADPARRLSVRTVDDYAAALASIAAGQAQALAADDILMAGYLAERRLQRDYAIVGELLSYESYGIVHARNDEALAAVISAGFERLARSRELRTIYNAWFLRPLPSGVRLGVPMSTQLARSFEILGLPPD